MNDSLLVLKLILTPLLIGLVSLAERRWGTRVGGWLVGLPLTSAPVSLFIVLELGTAFASHMAVGILLGLISQAAFCLTYAWLAFRLNWVGSWLIGWGCSGVSTLALEQVSVTALSFASIASVFLAVISALVLVLFLWPRIKYSTGLVPAVGLGAYGSGAHDRGNRFCTVADRYSKSTRPTPQRSAVTSAYFLNGFRCVCPQTPGRKCGAAILHGVVVSSFACAVFFLVVIAFIEQWSPVAVFSAATFFALLTQGLVLWLLRRYGTGVNQIASRPGRRWMASLSTY